MSGHIVAGAVRTGRTDPDQDPRKVHPLRVQGPEGRARDAAARTPVRQDYGTGHGGPCTLRSGAPDGTGDVARCCGGGYPFETI